jgi:tetratricopeptide (TPR) repeat protein
MTDKIPTGALAPELSRQEAELAAMRRMLAASRATFSFSVAICNSPALRDHLIRKLQSEAEGIAIAAVPRGTVDVYHWARAAVPPGTPAALFIAGLEESVPSTDERFPTLRALNASRELWAEAYRCPVVFWLPEYAATLLSIHARDLWSWVSHHFEFVSEMATLAAGLSDSAAGDLTAASNLTAGQKRFRIAELEQRIAEAGEIPPLPLVGHVVTWIRELADLWKVLGELPKAETALKDALVISQRAQIPPWTSDILNDLGLIARTRGAYDEAERMFRESLKIDESGERHEGAARAYANLGLIAQTRGDLVEAENLLWKSLAIFESLGRLGEIATCLGNLGVIALNQNRVDQADDLFRRSLEINERLGHRPGQASQYCNLGLVAEARGDLEEAERMLQKSAGIFHDMGHLEGLASAHGNLGLVGIDRGDLDEAEGALRKSLEINLHLGRLEGVATQHANLGLIARKRGNLDEAEWMHRKSLEIEEQLDHPEGMASQYANLGSIAGLRGDPHQARELWSKARDLYAKIGMPHMVKRVQGWLDAMPPEG